MIFNVTSTGVHAVIMWMWGDKSGPCMQFLHFAYAFGAFIAPLISNAFYIIMLLSLPEELTLLAN